MTFWYSCVDGDDDLHPDLMIGRLCVSDTTELGREVQKIVDYEENASSTDDWRTRILMTSGFCTEEDENKAATAYAAFEHARTLITNHTVTEIHAGDQIGDCGERQTAVQTAQRESISAGLHLLELCAHGCNHGCETFWREDVALLENNEGQLPFWLSYSCLTGAYDAYNEDLDNWECLGEALMHQEPNLTGTVGFFGASENSGNAWADIGTYVWEAIFNHGHNRTGGFITYAKLKFQALRAGVGHNFRHDLMYNLLGDPALDLFLTDTEGVGYSSAPDYIVRSCDVEVIPDEFPCSGDTVRFRVEVLNESNYIPDGPVDVLFELWNPGSSLWDSLGTTQVEPGDWSSETTSTLWTTSSSYAGRRELRIRVDPNGEQDELSELNNEAERPVCVYIERDGFPVNMWGADGVAPVFVDINGDGRDDVVSGTRTPGHIAAFSSSSADSLWAYAAPQGDALLGPVSIADLNIDGDPEIVFTRTSYVDALNLDGDPASEWSPRMSKGLIGAAALGDVCDGDSLGDVEIAVERAWTVPNWQHFVRVVGHDGAGDEWEVSRLTASLDVSFVERSPIVVDLDGDGRGEVVAAYVAVSNALGVDAAVSAYASHDGDELWSVEFFGQAGELPCSPVAADVVDDSTGIEIVCAAGSVVCLSSRGHTCWGCDIAGGAAGLAIEDLDADGELEVIVATYHAPGSIVDCSGTLYVIDSGGSVVNSIATDRAFTTQPVMADLDGDGDMEILTMSCRDEMLDWERKTISHLDIFTFNDGTLERFDELERPFLFWGMATGTPAIRDTDQDGFLEIWIADGEGLLHCLDLAELEPPVQGELSRWPSFQHDERHTGVYETPVSGPYSAYTEASWWGDYLLTGDVTIDATSSLLVQAGTRVRVASDDDQESGVDTYLTELIVHGDMAASGDGAFAPTVFASAASEPSPGNWYGIRVCEDGTGEIDGCTVRDAFIGITATEPDVLAVENCVIESCAMAGIKCKGPALGTSDILIFHNLISGAQTGIDLSECEATVDTNTITYCGSYGISMTWDKGSDITRNVISFPFSAFGGPFAGIRLDVNSGTAYVTDNSITNARSSGITCGFQGTERTEVYITGNTILDQQASTTSKGMYFYQSKAIPRWNHIVEKRDGFWIEEATGLDESPNLGITMGDGGYNCVDGTWLRYGVRADPGCLTTVMAEANWWGTANPSERLFMGLVDWHPFLVSPPRGAGEGEDAVEEKTPFCLIQNSPNPFNPVTSLRFGLPARQAVTLSIYDVAGRRVTTLVDGTMDPGWHDVVWDGRDDAQHRVSSGVYFCRLISQGSTSVKKVVLLK